MRLLRKKFALQAPELIQAEFGNVLWKKCRAGELDGTTAGEILDNLRRSPLVVRPHGAFMRLAWEIALKHRQTFYDSLYLALAMAEKARMVTADPEFYEHAGTSRDGISSDRRSDMTDQRVPSLSAPTFIAAQRARTR